LAITLPAWEPIKRIVPIAIARNDSDHHRILCDILSFLPTNLVKKVGQFHTRQKQP
jgi:hypothetical protein